VPTSSRGTVSDSGPYGLSYYRYSVPVALLIGLYAFLREHRRSGELNADVEEIRPGRVVGVDDVYVWGGDYAQRRL